MRFSFGNFVIGKFFRHSCFLIRHFFRVFRVFRGSHSRVKPTRTSALLIRTPEGIVFSQFLAGPMSRFLACAIDLVCIAAASSILSSVLGALALVSIDFARALAMLLVFVLSIGYGITLEWRWR